ncbi:MAG: RsmE family RNA methyltransferase [Oscillospiraceae bacterium]
MPKFFCDNVTDEKAYINGTDAVHIGRSLRMKIGDEITVCSNGIDYFTAIESISDEMVICKVLYSQPSETEPNIKLTLFQAMPKSDKLEFIVQKAVELGAYKIVPIMTARCISRPDKKSFAKKRERLQKIALSAAKQCGRGIVPEIAEISDIDDCIAQIKEMDLGLMCYEKGGKSFGDAGLKPHKNIGLIIGSEGGFEKTEAERFISSGITPIGLGDRILRCETAPLAAISIIMHLTGNM